MSIIRVTDRNGIFLRDDYDYAYNHDAEIGLDVDPAQGLYRPKWDGEKWIEGMSQVEIDALQIVTPEPTIEDRVGAVENKTATIEETLDVLFGGAV